ncbi:hypothetical protein ABK040_008604 [Willaertia magna]
MDNNTPSLEETQTNEEISENQTLKESQDQQEEQITSNKQDDQQLNSQSPQTRSRKGSYRQRSVSAASEKQEITTNINQLNRTKLTQLSDQMFHNFVDLLQGEMEAGFNELTLLEQMNKTISNKYEGLNQQSDEIRMDLQKMRQMYESLQTYFQQVDDIDRATIELATIVNYLDQYTKQLEIQLKPYL